MSAATATWRKRALSLLLLVACGGGPSAMPAAKPAPKPVATTTADAGDVLPSLDAIATRGAVDAPQMREIARWERVMPRALDAKDLSVKADRETCVRVAFAASASVRVRLETTTGDKRGEPTSGTDGLLPPQGPVCLVRGEAVRMVVEAADPAVTVRAVVFAAP